MRLSHNGYLELILRAQRNAFHRGGRLRSRLFANIGIRISLTNLTFELIPTSCSQRNRYAFTIVEFKMARRQGATRSMFLCDLRPRSNAGAGPFQLNPPGRGSLGEFSRRSLGQYRSGCRRFARSSKFAQTPRGDCEAIPITQH